MKVLIFIAFVVIVYYLFRRMIRTSEVRRQTPTPEIDITPSDRSNTSGDPKQEPGDQDAWEGLFMDATNPLNVEITLRLDYTDGNGNQTERVVDVKQYDESLYGGIVLAHCHLRQGTRTFRIDRINSCVVEGTGEVVDDVRAFLRDIYDKSVHSTIDKLRDEEHDLLRVFLFIGKADGRLMKKEVDIIATMCRDLTGDQRVTGEIVSKMLNQIEVPSITAFRRAVGTLVSLPDERRLAIIRNAESIVGTQKIISGAEQDAIEYLKKKLTTKVSAPSSSPISLFPVLRVGHDPRFPLTGVLYTVK